MSKIPAEEHWGLEVRYVALKGSDLSDRTREDLRRYDELKRKTRDYLGATLEEGEILRSDFDMRVENYLVGHTNLPNLASKEKQGEAIIRIQTVLAPSFNVRDDPARVGQYDIGSLERAVDGL
jgi:hypothetical protein